MGSILHGDPEVEEEVQGGLGLHSYTRGAVGCDLDLPGSCLQRVIHGHYPELPKVASVT